MTKMKRSLIALTDQQWKALEAKSKETKASVNALVREAVQMYLERDVPRVVTLWKRQKEMERQLREFMQQPFKGKEGEK